MSSVRELLIFTAHDLDLDLLGRHIQELAGRIVGAIRESLESDAEAHLVSLFIRPSMLTLDPATIVHGLPGAPSV